MGSLAQPEIDSQPGTVYALESQVETSPFDSSSSVPTLLVATDDGKHYQLGGLARCVVLSLSTGAKDFAHLKRELIDPADSCFTDYALTEILQKLTLLKIITGQREHGTTKKKQSSYFAVRIPIVSYNRLAPLTSSLAPIFSPRLISFLLPAMFFLQVIFWWTHPHLLQELQHLPGGWRLGLLFAASYAGLFLHELGHAAACTRYGVKHGSIGLAIYLIFPAAYTDVSQAWRLPRRYRAVIDVAGIYMSLAAASAATVALFATGDRTYLVLIAVYDMTVLFNLNPFIRMDGYWLLSDALGIANLMSVNRASVRWAVRRLFKRSAVLPDILASRPTIKYAYVLYLALFVAFSGYMGVRLLFWYLPALAVTYKTSVIAIIDAGKQSLLNVKIALMTMKLLLASIPAVGLGVYFYRGLCRCGRALLSWSRS